MKTFTVPVTTRYSDIDMNGHVNNAVYFTYMENARTELLFNEFTHYLKRDTVFIIAEANCRYKRPVLLSDNIVCDMNFELLSPLRISVSYYFRNTEKSILHAEGRTIMVMVNKQTNRPVAIPQELINRMTD